MSGYAFLPLRRRDGEVVAWTMVDADLFDELAQHTWRFRRGYAMRTVYAGNYRSRHIFLHRVVLGEIEAGLEPDHINRDGLDNRRANLRAVTHAQNMQNLPLRRVGTSRHRGVSWSKQSKKWQAACTLGAVPRHLGYFTDESEAASVARAFRAAHMPYAVEEAVA